MLPIVWNNAETNIDQLGITDEQNKKLYQEIKDTFKDYDMAEYSLGIFEDPEMDIESEEEVEAELAKLEAPLKIKSLDKHDDIRYINFNEEQVEQIKQDIRENLGFGYDDEDDEELEEGIFGNIKNKIQDKKMMDPKNMQVKYFGYDKNSKNAQNMDCPEYREAKAFVSRYPKTGKLVWGGYANGGWKVTYSKLEKPGISDWDDEPDYKPGPSQAQVQTVDDKTDIRLMA